MSIKNALVAAAVASALGTAAGSAQAATLQIKQYGSSAVVTVIERALFNNCGSDFAEYRDATAANSDAWGAGGGNYRTYTCTLASNSNTGTLGGTTIEYDERG